MSFKITSVVLFQLKCNCINGSVINVIREPILFSFALDNSPGQKTYKQPRVKPFEKMKKICFISYHVLSRRC